MNCFKKQKHIRTCVGCSAFITLTRKELTWPAGLIHPDISDAELRKRGLFGKCALGVPQKWLDWGIAIPLKPCQKNILSPMYRNTLYKNKYINTNLLMNERMKIYSIKQYIHNLKIWFKNLDCRIKFEFEMLFMLFILVIIPGIIALYMAYTMFYK